MRPVYVPAMILAAGVALAACSTPEPEASTYKVPGSDADVQIPDTGPDRSVLDANTAAGLTLTGVKPTHGPFVGGNKVTLGGSGFSASCKVQIGGKNIQVGQSKLVSGAAFAVTAPAGKPGAADVQITCGSDKAVLKDAYTYDAVYMTPSSGPTAGGTLVEIFGTGTTFAAGMKLSLGGKVMTEVSVIGATSARAKTPPNSRGDVDLVVGSGSSSVTVKDAFNYYVSTSPKAGGLGGGPIAGTLTISVLDATSRAPIESAAVVVSAAGQKLHSGLTNTSGVLVFAKTGLIGPVNVTAGKSTYESTTVVDMDARDVTILLFKISPPSSGPGGPGLLAAQVQGNVVFGGSTGVGTSAWKIVPEPKTDEVKRAYIYRSLASIGAELTETSKVPYVDHDPTSSATTWPYKLTVSPGMMAVYAVAGLYNKTSSTFVPYAMGVTRGVVVGPGGMTQNVDIVVQAPLSRTITLQLKDVPSSSKMHHVRLGIDLGAEGFIVRGDMETSGTTSVPASITFNRLPPFNYQGLTDASWAVDVALDGGGTKASPSLPYVRGTSRSMKAASDTLVMDKFVGPASLDDPVQGQYLQNSTLKWTPTGAPAQLIVTLVVAYSVPPTPVWRIISPGDATSVTLPDPKTAGLNDWTPGKLHIWAQWMIHLHPGYDFDKFTYDHLSSYYWDRWSQQQSYFQLPVTP